MEGGGHIEPKLIRFSFQIYRVSLDDKYTGRPWMTNIQGVPGRLDLLSFAAFISILQVELVKQ